MAAQDPAVDRKLELLLFHPRTLLGVESRGYDRRMERAVHDRGGWMTDAPIDRSEHELADWEVLTDALVGALATRGLMNVDELRRGIESMPPHKYERATYYERWLYSLETVLTEKGVITPGELDRRLGS
jgi:nitrile hydratase